MTPHEPVVSHSTRMCLHVNEGVGANSPWEGKTLQSGRCYESSEEDVLDEMPEVAGCVLEEFCFLASILKQPGHIAADK